MTDPFNNIFSTVDADGKPVKPTTSIFDMPPPVEPTTPPWEPPTDEQIAATQARIAAAYDAWSDRVEAELPTGDPGMAVEGGPEHFALAVASAEQHAELHKAVTDAIADPAEADAYYDFAGRIEGFHFDVAELSGSRIRSRRRRCCGRLIARRCSAN